MPRSRVYHAIGGKLVSGSPFPFPALPSGWGRAFNIYETPFTAATGGQYVVNDRVFTQYLDWMERPNQYARELWDFHSAGSCERGFDGPIILDFERNPVEGVHPCLSHPEVIRAALAKVRAWRPFADVFLYGDVARAAYEWDSNPAGVKAQNDATSRTTQTPSHHAPMYLKNSDAAATWERFNDRNCLEVRRAVQRDGGRGYVTVGSFDHDGTEITDINRLYAQVRPAIRYELDIIVWDYWFNTSERDASLAGLALLDQAIRNARADLWNE
jgi:hypothetical protein